jgi:hypothetical protein
VPVTPSGLSDEVADDVEGDQNVIIEGYLDGWEPPFATSPLVDAGAMLTRPGFWPAFLHTVGDSESAVQAFENDPADVSALIDELDNPEVWPVFPLRLHRGHLLHIVMRNFPEDAGVDYVLSPSDGGQHIPLAAMEGTFAGRPCRGPSWSRRPVSLTTHSVRPHVCSSSSPSQQTPTLRRARPQSSLQL